MVGQTRTGRYMKQRYTPHFLSRFLLLALLFFATRCWSHPTGNMMIVGETLLWSYVYPLDDTAHRACLMVWDEEGGARPWLVSEHAASNWMVAPADSDEVYLIERYYDPAMDAFWMRMLRAEIGVDPVEVWPWGVDPHRLGEGGFAVLADGRVLFARYPNIYTQERGQEPTIWRVWPQPVSAIHPLADGRLLIRSTEAIWLVSATGEIEQYWGGLLQEITGDAPFAGNRIFDADFGHGGLWVAYWGQRRFERYTDKQAPILVKQLASPWLPHAVAAGKQDAFLLASSVDPGRAVRPRLWRWKEQGLELIWSGAK